MKGRTKKIHRHTRIRTLVAIAAAVMLPLTSATDPVQADAGDLDTSFGSGGLVTTGFATDSRGPARDFALDVAIMRGRIVVAGWTLGGIGLSDFALACYNADGSMDTGFGGRGAGKITTDFGGLDFAYAVAIQSNNKIVAAGSSERDFAQDFALARYNFDGTLDSAFGRAGKVLTDFSDSADQAYDLAIQSDGKLVVVGKSNSDFALARYDSDGSLDSTFGTDGKVTTDFSDGTSTSSDNGNAVAIQTDGKIVVAGNASNLVGSFSYRDVALARYNTDGSLDSTFGIAGKVVSDWGSSYEGARALAIQEDGKMLVAGIVLLASSPDFALARYNTDGSLDLTFGTGGLVTTDFFGYGDNLGDVAIAADGKIVAAGSAATSFDATSLGNIDLALARYNTDGSLDTSFGTAGKVTTDFFGNSDGASAIAIQFDGLIVTAGTARTGTSASDDDFALARYQASP